MDPSKDSRGSVTSAQVRLLATALVITVLDQVVKRVVVTMMRMGESTELLGSVVRLTRTSNTGAAFGIFRGGSVWFAGLSFVAAILIASLSRKIARGRRIERVAFSLILGGTVGNLIDRVRLGAVVDFIDIGAGTFRWPAFNVADSAITIGVTLLAVSLLFLGGARASSAPSPGEGR